jgi:hypothetical protein
MKVSFRIRRVYFDQIVKGEKTEEFRRDNDYWTKVVRRLCCPHCQKFISRRDTLHPAINFSYPYAGSTCSGPHIAVFLCGKDVYRCQMISVHHYATARDGLGRDPSDQGKKDIGEGPVWGFKLGRKV